MLVDLRKRFRDDQPFKQTRIGVCLPGTWEAFMFLMVLEAGGARVLYYPMFLAPEVGIELLKVKAIKLFDYKSYGKCVTNSDFIYDSTALLGKVMIKQNHSVKGIVEQTASGITIYRDFDNRGLLSQPVLNLDGSFVKEVGENRLATGLGLVEALLRLHIFLPDKEVLVLGFGRVGSGCAMYLRRIGCGVTISDIDSEKLIDAKNSGYKVGTIEEALAYADIVVNATGSSHPVLKAEEFQKIKTGAVLANMGGCGWDQGFFHDKKIQTVGDSVRKITLDKTRYIYELAHGYPVNFILASGTDTETMDMVFSLGALSMAYLVTNHNSLPSHLLSIPEEIQKEHIEQVKRFYPKRRFHIEVE